MLYYILEPIRIKFKMLCLKAPTEGALCKKGSKLFHFIIVEGKNIFKKFLLPCE